MLADAIPGDDRSSRREGRGQEQALQRAGHQPGGDEPPEMRHDRGSENHHRKQRQGAHEDGPTVQPGRRRRQQRAADRQAERVRAEQRAGRRHRHPECGRDQRQQTRRQQFGRAGDEGAQQQAGQHDTAATVGADVSRNSHDNLHPIFVQR
jgi:hypothetical protein